MDLLDQWLTFCKRCAPGTRFWLNDELFDRLFDRLGQEARFYSEPPAYRGEIYFRGGYQHGGLTFYPKSFYPNPPRRLRSPYPSLSEFSAR